MSDEPFRGAVDPLGSRSARFAIRRPPRPPRVRVPFAFAAMALGALAGVAGDPRTAITFGGIGMIGVGDWLEGRHGRRPIATVDVHERGLRIGRDIAWTDLREITVDTTADQRAAPTTLTIASQGEPAAIVGTAATVGPLVAAIEAAVAPRHHREAVTRLDAGGEVPYGPHAFDSHGLRASGTVVPWRQLGPIRRFGGQVIVDSKIGEFSTPIGGVPNPWVLERLIDERGWLAR